MNKVAIYPGTFDPITYGHIDVIKKGLKLFDKIIVAVSDVENKNYLFNAVERIQIVKKAIFSDLKLSKNKVTVISFIETLFLMSDVENQIISSRFVKEIVKLKGDIKKFTTKSTIKSLKEKYE
ncbi:MAG: pantetheine-phosphate adenylyltransferase [Proteobacteria bacterium]|nr:pantetheine-phosphate adenylyltransferase [Pseudomonadota bacterium]